MSSDSKGYYADLGVSPTASVEDIRAVYRALAKIYHPDVNRDRAAAEKFRRVTTAYEVLTDAVQRRAYDGQPTSEQQNQSRSSERSSSQSPQQTPPVQCSECGQATAQPRFVVFRHVISLIFVTRIQPRAGIYCSSCASKVGFRASAISAFFGWWGLPWGPIYTVRAILKNAFGGDRQRALDEGLLWHNAVAFLSQGRFDLSAALASKLRSAMDPAIAESAARLSAQLSANNVRVGRLRSPWSIHPATVLGHLILVAIVPSLAALLLLGGSVSGGAKLSQERPTQSTPSTAASPTMQPAIVDLCTAHPRNGTVLSGGFPPVQYGHRLTINNGSSEDAIVKVRNAKSGRTVVSFFAARQMTSVLDNIPDGRYRIQFAFGDAMSADCRRFLDLSASEFPDAQSFATRTTATQIYTEELSFTLHAVAGGNVRPSGISDAAFNAD